MEAGQNISKYIKQNILNNNKETFNLKICFKKILIKN